MAEFHPPEGLLEAVTKIVSEKWGPCEDDVCEADRSGLGTDCTAVRGTVADVLAALFEACEVREEWTARMSSDNAPDLGSEPVSSTGEEPTGA